MSLRGVRPRLLAVALFAVPVLAQADDSYPTIPDDQDYMCETIARSPSASVPPGDRAWFNRTCTCTEAKVCGRAGSRRYAARLQAGPGDGAAAAGHDDHAVHDGCQCIQDTVESRPSADVETALVEPAQTPRVTADQNGSRLRHAPPA